MDRRHIAVTPEPPFIEIRMRRPERRNALSEEHLREWVHAVAVYNGSTMKLYLNGSEVGSMAASGTLTGNGSVPIAIGRNPQVYGAFDGNIDQVRIYNRALSTTEVNALYTHGQ